MQSIEKILIKVQKPSRYTGGEFGSIVKEKSDVKFALCFPDLYDIGMSNSAIQILYYLINEKTNYSCERVFAPWIDFEEQLREKDIPLYSLESKTNVSDFDIIGFSLGYELCYTNVLNMLNLSKIPLYRRERPTLKNLVIAGGVCCANPAPLSDFIDIFVYGDGEEVIVEILDLYNKCKKDDISKSEFLNSAAKISGVYVPEIGNDFKRRVVKDLDTVYFPDKFIIPNCQIVHERASVEILRGCRRGCKFCQACFVNSPFREKSKDVVISQAKALCENTGYDELSLLSLSSGDHSQIDEIMGELVEYTTENNINLTLPSLRIDNFSDTMLEKLRAVRKSGLTFAPEAGTQRLRDVINKNINEEEIFAACKKMFESGVTSVKLYFMIGLPTETDEDIIGISDLCDKIVYFYQKVTGRKNISISISVSTFVPKPKTPFENAVQNSTDEIIRKQNLLKSVINRSKVKLSYHDPYSSKIEWLLAGGGAEMCDVIYNVWKNGAKFDSWNECFNYEIWAKALGEK
ncbi:MAG: TIGR03960 family B12-binding radical SAM protein [Ruminococcus sp.]|jgi:radical SAM family uncharacterized protein|nr:TIGR03960 family B12-binding radical SAM protein [Ruminococcus sp.]